MTVSVKSMLKSILPKGMVSTGQSILGTIRTAKVYRADRHRFERNYSRATNLGPSQIESKLIFYAHSIEKGLSHDVMRLGFGRAPLTALANYLEEFESLGIDEESPAYVNAISTLSEYIAIHKKQNYEVDFLEEVFPSHLLIKAKNSTSRLGGKRQVCGSQKDNNPTKNFKELFQGRSSVREYAASSVDLSTVHEAVEIAMKSPSVCNRQASRVHIIQDPKNIEEVLKIQGGFTGYETPPCLIAVTSDLSFFFSRSERNQPFIDGGLFSMSLLLALEYKKLAACPLNAMMNEGNERLMREVLNLPDNEVFIMFISVGNFKEVTNVPSSFRYSASEISRII